MNTAIFRFFFYFSA
ncbi:MULTISPECIES: pheST operon leader peptide PheM [Enterobacterales]|uniref:PheST operon leader peptide PheM n=5 Tax=Enterobacterales TaxID=91347 RepID=A0ACC5RPR8_ENTAG|nr:MULTISPECIES: pheST operon leader peptide PheM [Enterobacterales]MDN5680091.1 pheST operon leader peptide PheM [Ewingella sp.]NWA37977.1 pheST operon leader peptide PheM [Pseudomonas reactans]MBC3944290.1 pheST operon leader peptide PheM [Erwinia persicina]MBD8105315.1 pheST operon leader peptide PheM [Erwinia persicina]MBD8161802.1 pheST operon leader peptide PheM [Erwinia persicina]